VTLVKRLPGFPGLRHWLPPAGFTTVTGHDQDGQPLTADHTWKVSIADLVISPGTGWRKRRQRYPAGGLDDPEFGEVLLVPNVGGSRPHGWSRPVV
jgi:hypothetical protein